jgi:putative ABC transport system substrate-binding protein
MQRREFILGGAAAAWPLAARAQPQPIPVVGFLSSASPTGWDIYLAAFRDGLRSQGFVEGKNVKLEYRWAEGKFDHLPALAAELVHLRPALMVASGGPARPLPPATPVQPSRSSLLESPIPSSAA